MKSNVNFSDFVDSFKDMDRENNFSYKGKEALYNYLIELEEDTGQELNLDVIAICCDYSEYKNLDEYLKDYSNQHEKSEDESEEEFKTRIEEEINDKTTLIKFSDDLNEGFIIQQY